MAASEGVDLEWAIVDYVNTQMSNKIVSSGKTYSKKIEDQAKKCTEHIIKYAAGKRVEAWHSDDSTNPFGIAIYAKPEPKTDIILKIGSKVYSTSVKMAGGVQLASGQGSSTADLFEAASKSLSNSKKKTVLSSIIKELRVLPTRLLSQSNLNRILTEGSDSTIKEFVSRGKIISDKSYDLWLKNNKPKLMSDLLSYIQKDKEFTEALLYESMTGEQTLKSYRGAVADSIISPKGFYVIDSKYVSSIMNKIKFDIRGKSRSGITGLAFRIDLKA